jgi:hypothetical protein
LKEQQALEYGDISDSGRKVDLIFKYNDIELSNVEFKHPDIQSKDIAHQSRKNMRLGRCIQVAHEKFGVKDAPVIMGDVAGMRFFWFFWNFSFSYKFISIYLLKILSIQVLWDCSIK